MEGRLCVLSARASRRGVRRRNRRNRRNRRRREGWSLNPSASGTSWSKPRNDPPLAGYLGYSTKILLSLPRTFLPSPASPFPTPGRQPSLLFLSSLSFPPVDTNRRYRLDLDYSGNENSAAISGALRVGAMLPRGFRPTAPPAWSFNFTVSGRSGNRRVQATRERQWTCLVTSAHEQLRYQRLAYLPILGARPFIQLLVVIGAARCLNGRRGLERSRIDALACLFNNDRVTMQNQYRPRAPASCEYNG